MGKDLTALMDQSNLSGFPFPAMPAEARVALMLLEVRRLRRHSAGHSQHAADRAAADRPDSQPAGHRSGVHPLARRPGRLRLLHRSRPDARREQGVLGTADQGRHAAAGAERRHGRLHQRREPALLLRSGEEQDSAGLHLQLADRRQFSDSDAADHAAQSAAGPDSAAAHQPAAARPEPVRRRSRQAADSAGHHDGPRAARRRTPTRSPARARSTSRATAAS